MTMNGVSALAIDSHRYMTKRGDLLLVYVEDSSHPIKISYDKAKDEIHVGCTVITREAWDELCARVEGALNA